MSVGIPLVAGAVTLFLIAALVFLPNWTLRARRRWHRQRAPLWEWLYGMNWGDVATNNYGFAPADGEAPERFQHQMYLELLRRAQASGRLGRHTDLLEVSCGRGGGLVELLDHWPGHIVATGFDLSENALGACRRLHGCRRNLRFVRGSALDLPFPDASFDVVVNVEASNDYGDYARFYREVSRVLRPGGLFLHCDTRRPDRIAPTQQMLREAGLTGTFEDITDHVIEACRLDSPRRLRLIREQASLPVRLLLGRELRRYAAVEGSRKFDDFMTRRRSYMMVCAVNERAAGSVPHEITKHAPTAAPARPEGG